MAGTILGVRTIAVIRKAQINGHSNPLITLIELNQTVSLPIVSTKRTGPVLIMSPGHSTCTVPRT